jgi:hypothetical protein
LFLIFELTLRPQIWFNITTFLNKPQSIPKNCKQFGPKKRHKKSAD